MVDCHTSQNAYLYLEVLDGMVAEGSSGILDTHHLGKMQIFGESVIGHSMQDLRWLALFPGPKRPGNEAM